MENLKGIQRKDPNVKLTKNKKKLYEFLRRAAEKCKGIKLETRRLKSPKKSIFRTLFHMKRNDKSSLLCRMYERNPAGRCIDSLGRSVWRMQKRTCGNWN